MRPPPLPVRPLCREKCLVRSRSIFDSTATPTSHPHFFLGFSFSFRSCSSGVISHLCVKEKRIKLDSFRLGYSIQAVFSQDPPDLIGPLALEADFPVSISGHKRRRVAHRVPSLPRSLYHFIKNKVALRPSLPQLPALLWVCSFLSLCVCVLYIPTRTPHTLCSLQIYIRCLFDSIAFLYYTLGSPLPDLPLLHIY